MSHSVVWSDVFAVGLCLRFCFMHLQNKENVFHLLEGFPRQTRPVHISTSNIQMYRARETIDISMSNMYRSILYFIS